MNIAVVAAASLLSLAPLPGAQEIRAPAPKGHQLVLVGVGRFAVFADLDTIERRGGAVHMRALQVGEEDLVVAGERYWGGWSWWAFDCTAATADRLDFASVRESGAEGPPMADATPPYPAAPGGDAAELMAVACDPALQLQNGVATASEAVRVGREALADASR